MRLSRWHLRSIWSGLWAGGAIPAARRVLFLAVRAAWHRGWTAGEDRSEIATLRAGRVRAAILRSGVGERTEVTNWQCGGTVGSDVAEFPAFLALGVLRGGEHLLHSPVSGEEVDGGEDSESVRWGQGDNH